MRRELDGAALVREARRHSGLTQRALATRAGTSQSVVARIEGGRRSPSIATLRRLLAAAGVEPRVELEPVVPAVTHMLEDVPRILSLTPEQRLLEVRNFSRFQSGARRV